MVRLQHHAPWNPPWISTNRIPAPSFAGSLSLGLRWFGVSQVSIYSYNSDKGCRLLGGAGDGGSLPTRGGGAVNRRRWGMRIGCAALAMATAAGCSVSTPRNGATPVQQVGAGAEST